MSRIRPAAFLALLCVTCNLGELAFANSPDPVPPNFLVIIADDLGYTDLGCFGSEIATPAIDELAAHGVTLTNFHTAATCSPTRAMLLTGVDHHLAGMGNMYEFLSKSQRHQPGYEGHLNDGVVTIAELLSDNGYRTCIAGKWHLGKQQGRGPSSRGFEKSWVLLDGAAHHYHPRDHRTFREDGIKRQYPAGEYSADVYTRKLEEYLEQFNAEQRPFFAVASYTLPHWPLQAPDELVRKYRGRYDGGYDKLRQDRIRGLVKKGVVHQFEANPITKYLPVLHHGTPSREYRPWEQLLESEKAVEARKMEVYAAMVEALDQSVGRLIGLLEKQQRLNNTVIIFLSDNGAAPADLRANSTSLDSIGKPDSAVGYGAAWAHACSGPFRMVKGFPTEGGIRTPCIIRMPGVQEGRKLNAFASVRDIAPTIYDIAQVSFPEKYKDTMLIPIQGRSLIPYVQGKTQAVYGQGDGIGWELFGRAAYRIGDWKIVWAELPFGQGKFELFNVETDPGETRDLRSQSPEKFDSLFRAWQTYVDEHGVILHRPEHWE